MKTNRPHIIKVKGLWYCIDSSTTLGSDYGIGFTPSDAYIDWYVRRGAA